MPEIELPSGLLVPCPLNAIAMNDEGCAVCSDCGERVEAIGGVVYHSQTYMTGDS